MDVKIFGDVKPINYTELGVAMPFAPLYKLAKNYVLEKPHTPQITLGRGHLENIQRTFETKKCLNRVEQDKLLTRIRYRVRNTVSALDGCASDIVCVNIGGGTHHAGKYPNTGYAYSLINDHIWSIDYQLEQNPKIKIEVSDCDFHFGGGTVNYYKDNNRILVISAYNQKYGKLYNHVFPPRRYHENRQFFEADKCLINLSTDLCMVDKIFGKYSSMTAKIWLQVAKANVIDAMFWDRTLGNRRTSNPRPIAITLSGGYGEAGLALYAELIEWLKAL